MARGTRRRVGSTVCFVLAASCAWTNGTWHGTRPWRSSGFIGGSTLWPAVEQGPKGPGVVVVDRSGDEETRFLRDGAKDRGLPVAELWTGQLVVTARSTTEPYSGPAPESGEALTKWLEELPFRVRGVMAFSDFLSLPVAEEIAAKVGLLGTGVVEDDARLARARRDKFQMQAVVQKAGLASARQALVYSPDEAREFAFSEGGVAVMKPFVGMRGLNVTLLDYKNAEREAEELVQAVFKSRPPEYADSPLLLQEVLEGEEFACDIAAREGDIAVTAIFKYDRRRVNGAAFVMYGALLEAPAEGSAAEAAAHYAIDAMSAVGMRNGLAHIEVKVTPDRGPVLVEVNCHRFNGQPCFTLTREAIGYTHMDAFLDAAMDDVSAEEWRSRYPPLPPRELRAFGGCAELHVLKGGVYKGGDEECFQELQAMESVMGLEAGPADPHVGEWLKPTVDKATVPVVVWMGAPDKQIFEEDYQQIWEIEKRMFATE